MIKEYPKDNYNDLTITFKLLMMLLRQYKVMDIAEINRFLGYKNNETCRTMLGRIMQKTDNAVNIYSFNYKNDKGEEFTKTFYYFGELTNEKLILAGGKYASNIRNY